MSVHIQNLPLLSERENLITEYRPKMSGFTPRSIQRLATQKKPNTILNIECNHYMRCPSLASASMVSGSMDSLTFEYKVWLEVGKLAATFPERMDIDYNSNIWRNFRKNCGFNLSLEDSTISEAIAAIYPLNIPFPSKVGGNTFAKYIAETKLFGNPKFKALAYNRSMAELQEFKKLRLKSDLRNPPIDNIGNIIPPKHYKSYPRHFKPPPEAPPTPPPANQRTDIFGQRTTFKTPYQYGWKLTAKMNNPQYEMLKREIARRKLVQDGVLGSRQGGNRLNIGAHLIAM